MDSLRLIIREVWTFLYTWVLIGGFYCLLPLSLLVWFFKRYFGLPWPKS
jgi:hypothetical protein